MEYSRRLRCLTAVTALVLALAGCNGSSRAIPAAPLPIAAAALRAPSTAAASDLVVANHTGNTVTRYRVNTAQRVLAGIAVPYQCIFGPDGTLYVVTPFGLRVYDVRGDLVRSIDTPANAAATDDAGRLYVAFENSVAIYSPHAETLLHSFETVHRNVLIAVNPAGTVIATAYRHDREPIGLNEYRPDGTLIVGGIGFGNPISAIHFGPDGDIYVLAYQNGGGPQSTLHALKPGSVTSSRQLAVHPHARSGFAFDSRGNAYVTERDPSDVAVFAPQGTAPARHITQGLSTPYDVAVGSDDSLFVANVGSSGNGTIVVYPGHSDLPWQSIATSYAFHVAVARDGRYAVTDSINGNVTLFSSLTPARVRTLSDGTSAPVALAFDAQNNEYVANAAANTIAVYAPHVQTPLRTISTGIANPASIALDSSGNLYVANNGANSVTVYKHGSSTPARTIVNGINAPRALAIDGQDRLFVANGDNAVTVYAPGASTASRRITDGINDPAALAFDGAGDLFVANRAGNTVVVFTPGSTLFERRITEGVAAPVALAFDASNHLYVANARANTVTEYTAATAKLMRTLSDGVSKPRAIAVDARGSGLLLVAEDGASDITAYDATSLHPVFAVTDGISGPSAIAFAP